MQHFLVLDLKNSKIKDVTDHESIKLSLDLCHLHKSVGVCIHFSRARLRMKTVLLLIFYLDYFLLSSHSDHCYQFLGISQELASTKLTDEMASLNCI